jgi:hypothetical protein
MTNPEPSNTVFTNSNGMAGTVHIEIVGVKNSECSPFPCNEDRTCGLVECHPSGQLAGAVDALKKELARDYGDRVEVQFTLIDDHVPDHVRTLIEKEYPPLPMILVNGRLTRIGRIVLDRIKKEIDMEL